MARANTRFQIWEPRRLATSLSVAQGAFYSASGLWPILGMRSFEKVTGPKADRWLVKTVGALVTAIGAGLLAAGLRRRTSPELGLTAAGAALGLAAIDVVYSRRGRISKVYLFDALGELALAAGWLAALSRGLERP